MTERTRAMGFLALGLLGAVGCDAFGTPVAEDNTRVVPVDDRPVQQALVSLPSISGGTLAVRGNLAVVADSDRDVVSVVNLQTGAVTGRIELNAGDEPGRVTFDGNGIAHVALRRAGELVAIDPAAASMVRRTPVCGAPRGVAYDASTDRLHVACAGGELVALAARTGAETWRTQLEVDLRDVVVRGDHLVVSRFKSAEQLHVTKEGSVTSKLQLAPVSQQQGEKPRVFDPAIAWRTVGDSNGEIVTLHQRAQRDEVVIDREPDPVSGGSSYGGGDTSFNFGPQCDGIVHSAVSITDSTGRVRTSAPIPGVVLAVDAAVSAQWVALAVAGPADADAPRPFIVRDDDSSELEGGASVGGFGAGESGVVLVSRSALSVSDSSGEPSVFGCESTTNVSRIDDNGNAVMIPEQVTAVAFTASGDLVYQTREPSTLNVVDSANLTGSGIFGGSGGAATRRIALGGESIADTGHDIFHRDSGGGIACASCHAEGGDDGHVWEFNTIGRRRTQAVNVGLEGTAPFHWDGDMSGLHEIMDTVFVNRMGGVRQSEERLSAMSGWVFEQTPPAAIRLPSDPAAVRGHELFMAPDVGCASCHSGTKLTNNTSVDVGTAEVGQRFQVPSLVGIGYRAPFMHTGCAGTLRERFTNTACAGGDQHGVTSQLNDGQIDDLVAYLETL